MAAKLRRLGDPPKHPAESGNAWLAATGTAHRTFKRRRDRLIAAELGVEPDPVAAAAERLFLRSVFADRLANVEVVIRTDRRASQDEDPPAFGSAKRKAYRSHAIRAVTREIGVEIAADAATQR